VLFDDVCAFNKVAQTLSFSRAAKQIGTSRSAISKKISRLEDDLGAKLLNRTTRRVSLTKAGQKFFDHTSDIDVRIERAAEYVRESESGPIGTVTFCLPSALGELLLPSLMADFKDTWPELRISIHARDHDFNLIGDSFDFGIRVAKQLEDSSLVSRRIGMTRYVLAASPAYLAAIGCPNSLSDLVNHSCIGVGEAANTHETWELHRGSQNCGLTIRFSTIADTYSAAIHAAIADGGIVWTPEAYISNQLKSGELQLILESMTDPTPYGIFAMFPHRQTGAKVRAVIDFLIDQLQAVSTNRRPSEEVIQARKVAASA